MSYESDIPDEMELKVFNLLARCSKPRPIQEIADEIRKDYDYTFNYLMGMRARRHLRFHNLDDGTQSVELFSVGQTQSIRTARNPPNQRPF
jgi:hypothetical protein